MVARQMIGFLWTTLGVTLGRLEVGRAAVSAALRAGLIGLAVTYGCN